jgi:hypothetical protein
MADLEKFNITPAEAILVKKVEEVIDTVNHKSDDTHLHDDRYLQLTGGTVTGSVKFDLGNTDAATEYISLKRGTTETKVYQTEDGTTVNIDENRILQLKKILSSNTSQIVLGTDIIQSPNADSDAADIVLAHKITDVNGEKIATTVGGRTDTLGFKFTEYNLNTGAASFFGTATNATTAEALKTAVSIKLTGAVTGSVTTSLNTPVSIATEFTTIPADKITGMISIDNIPREAMPDTVIVQNDEERFALTKEQVQNNDVVIVEGATENDPATMYWVIDDTKLNLPEGYRAFTSSIATAVPWSGVLDKPETFPPSAHTQAASTIIGLSTVATSGSFNDLSDVPAFVKTVNSVAANSNGNVDVINLKIQKITSAVDLNTYMTPGIWDCDNNRIAATCTNCPTQFAFYLEVIRFNNTRGVRQIVTSYKPDANSMFIRTYYNDTVTESWGTWREIAYRGTTLASYGITDAVKTVNSTTPDSAGNIALSGLPVKNLGSFANKTITDLQSALSNWLNNNTLSTATACFLANRNWIPTWNAQDTTTTLTTGEIWYVSIIGGHSTNAWAQLLITTYASGTVYTCARNNSTWEAVRLLAYSDAVSGSYLKLNGTSTMTGPINFSSAAGLDLKCNNVSVLKKSASSGVIIGGDSSTVKSVNIRPNGIASTTNESIFNDTGTLTLGSAAPSDNNDAVPKLYMEQNALITTDLKNINAETTNLNEYKRTGVYSIQATSSVTLTNAPITTPFTGVLEVYTAGDPASPQANDEYTQILYVDTDTSINIYTRKYKNSTWGQWNQFVRSDQKVNAAQQLYATEIPNGSDLNNYTTVGYYIAKTNGVAASLANCPLGVAFGLNVSTTGAGIRQDMYSSRVTEPKLYFRVKTGTTWSAWKIMGEDVDMTGYVKTTSNLNFTGDNTFEGSTEFAGDLIVGSKEDPAQFIFNGEPFTNGVPIGQVFPVMDGIVPSDALPLTGGLYSRAIYSALWDWVNEHAAERLVTEEVWQATKTANEGKWVPQYSTGDGSTTFRMPLWNSYTSGTSDTSLVGSYATDTQRNITGEFVIDFANSGYTKGAFVAGDATATTYFGSGGTSDAILKFDASRVVGADHTGSEVRPKTGYILWCVKARGGWTNVDNIDINTLQTQVATVTQQMGDAALKGSANTFTKNNIFNGFIDVAKGIRSTTPGTSPLTIDSSLSQPVSMFDPTTGGTVNLDFQHDLHIINFMTNNASSATINLANLYLPKNTELNQAVSRVVTLALYTGTAIPTITWNTANSAFSSVIVSKPNGNDPDLDMGAWNFVNILLVTNTDNSVYVFMFPTTPLVIS